MAQWKFRNYVFCRRCCCVISCRYRRCSMLASCVSVDQYARHMVNNLHHKCKRCKTFEDIRAYFGVHSYVHARERVGCVMLPRDVNLDTSTRASVNTSCDSILFIFWHNVMEDYFDSTSMDAVECAFVCSRCAFIAACNACMHKQQTIHRLLFYELLEIRVAIFFFPVSYTGSCLSNINHTASCAFKHTVRVNYNVCSCWKCGIVGTCAK